MKSIWDYLPPGTWNIFTVINFLSQLFVIIIAVGGILGFLFRRFIGAWIDAFFKRRLDNELEEKKAALVSETERLKADLTRELETEKRKLDEKFRIRAQIAEKNLEAYQLFHVEYGAIVTDLLTHSFTLTSNEANNNDKFTKIDEAHMHSSLLMHLGRLTATREAFRKADLYMEPDHKIRMAKIFGEMNIIIATGIATKKLDRDRILALNEACSLLGAELMIKATSSR